MTYPRLLIDLHKIEKNAELVKDMCNRNNISVTGVVKGFSGIKEITQAFFKAGYNSIASSRIAHLKRFSDLENVEKMLIRIPMLSEVEDVINYSDISLNSEKKVLKKLNETAEKLGLTHKVILMFDVGDLREGLFHKEELAELSIYVEKELNSLHLYGIGTNMTCYGTIVPTIENALKLVNAVEFVETQLNRVIEIISGGSTTSLPLLNSNVLPKRINHFRIGSAIITPLELITLWNTEIPGLFYETFTIEAEIIELNEKPTVPIGNLHLDGFGNKRIFVDKGIRKRAILAIGNADLGDCTKLKPLDSLLNVLGASSDHLLVDIENSNHKYKVGDKLKFLMHYQNVLFALNQITLQKIYL
ncbi:MAG: alanine racemase [Clostridia bacterium]